MKTVVTVATLALASSALGQGVRDTAQTLGTVVVTGERAPTSLASSVAAVTRIPGEELARMPHATLADVLRHAPGFAIVDFDGLGFDPQLMVRGFYGGGEAEYVVVLIDGRPVSQLQTGLVAWDVLPPVAAIEAIEIVRGSTSPLYGDAAIGGVINVITRGNTGSRPLWRWNASAGSFETYRAEFDASRTVPRGPAGLSGAIERTGGFRDHAKRTAGQVRVVLPLVSGTDHGLSINGRMHWRKFEEPGPLFESLMESDRNDSDPIFRFDHTRDQGYTYSLDGYHGLGRRTKLTGSLIGEIRDVDAVRTLAVAPGSGDTKLRETFTARAASNAQLVIADSPLPGTDWIVTGADLSIGYLQSEYYDVARGQRHDYAAASGERGQLHAKGGSRRAVGSIHAQYNLQASSALRLAIGGRFDALRDAFRPDQPDRIDRETVTHTAFSPRLGVNLRYMNNDRSTGNAYVTASRSFKAATLDQLYDLRSIPIPYPPYSVRLSNPELDPQHGMSIEAGLYQRATLSPSLNGTLALSAYQTAMKDEIDFDVAGFGYVNIGRSRHRGIEAGLTLAATHASLFTNYTLQDVVSRSGENEGRRLKAIPRQTLSAGGSIRLIRMFETSLLITHVGDVWLDDANTVALPDYTRLDARAAVPIGGVSLFVDVRNLLDKHYTTTGFLDPAGSGEPYYYPAAGRVLEIGLRSGW